MDGKVHDAQDGEKEAQNERTLDVQMKSMILWLNNHCTAQKDEIYDQTRVFNALLWC